MKDVLRSEKLLSAPNGKKITIWTDGTEKYLSVGVIYKALGYDGRFNHTTLLAMVFKKHSFALMTKVLPTAAQYVCYLDQIVPILQAFIKLTLTYKGDYVKDNARMEAERLIEMFNVKVFGKPSSVTVKTVDQPDEKSATTTSEDTTSAYDTETSLFEETANKVEEANSTKQPKKDWGAIPKVSGAVIKVIKTPYGELTVLQDTGENFYIKLNELYVALGYKSRLTLEESYLGEFSRNLNGLVHCSPTSQCYSAYWVNLRILIESALPKFQLIDKNETRLQIAGELIEILRREYQQLTKEPLFDETTEQVTTLEVPATKEINVEVENTAETTAPPPDAKSLLEQLANQTGVDKAIIADAILNDRQSKFDSEQKKLRDLLN